MRSGQVKGMRGRGRGDGVAEGRDGTKPGKVGPEQPLGPLVSRRRGGFLVRLSAEPAVIGTLSSGCPGPARSVVPSNRPATPRPSSSGATPDLVRCRTALRPEVLRSRPGRLERPYPHSDDRSTCGRSGSLKEPAPAGQTPDQRICDDRGRPQFRRARVTDRSEVCGTVW
jgi:hypothetical protein